MIRILVFIKHRLKFLWGLIEWFDGLLIRILYWRRINTVADRALVEVSASGLLFRRVKIEDLPELCKFFDRQPESAYAYFKSHAFDWKTLCRLLKNPSFLIMGVFIDKKVVGYFFLRLFLNKHSFTGYLVDQEDQGKGIAKKNGTYYVPDCLAKWIQGFCYG